MMFTASLFASIFAEVDLDSKRKTWEESCLEIAEVQEKSATSRKNLAAETKGTIITHYRCMEADNAGLFHVCIVLIYRVA
jgi:hypothetical protein